MAAQKKPEYVVLKGGGAKGAEEVFAYQALVERGQLDPTQIKSYAGTSAGSIVGCLFAFGMTSPQALQLMQDTHFESFMDGKSMDWLLSRSKEGLKWWKALPDAFHAKQAYNKLMKDAGLCDGDVFRAWIESQIKALVKDTKFEGKKNITFADLHELVETQPLKGRHFADLFIVGSNVNRQKTETFSFENTPHMCIADAVRISMSIPFVYKPWHRFDVNEKGERYQVSQDSYVDGGMHENDNFPLDTFDKDGVKNPRTIGFCLMPSRDYADVELHGGDKHRDIHSTGEFFDATLSMLEESKGSDRDGKKTQLPDPRAVLLSTDTVGTMDFSLTPEQRALLKAHAEIGAQEYAERLERNPMEQQLETYEALIDPVKAKLIAENEALKAQLEALQHAQKVERVVQTMKTAAMTHMASQVGASTSMQDSVDVYTSAARPFGNHACALSMIRQSAHDQSNQSDVAVAA